MIAKIQKAKYEKEYETKFGTLYLHRITYNDKVGFYSSKKKEQTTFVEGKEVEFTEETRKGTNGEYMVIKPVKSAQFSNFGRQLKKEQSRYSGFAVSYVKDLIVAGRVDIKDWKSWSKDMFQFMVDLDKTLDV